MDETICNDAILIWSSYAFFKVPHVPDIAGRDRIDERSAVPSGSIAAALFRDHDGSTAGRDSVHPVSGIIPVRQSNKVSDNRQIFVRIRKAIPLEGGVLSE